MSYTYTITMKSSAFTLLLSAVLVALIGATLLMPLATAEIKASSVKFEPEYMDLKNPEEIVTVTIIFEPKYSGQELNINASTVRLEGSLPIIPGSNYTGTKPPEWIADFDGLDVRDILWRKIYHVGAIINPQGNYVVELTITGNLYDGTPFSGTGHIKVKPGRASPPPPSPL